MRLEILFERYAWIDQELARVQLRDECFSEAVFENELLLQCKKSAPNGAAFVFLSRLKTETSIFRRNTRNSIFIMLARAVTLEFDKMSLLMPCLSIASPKWCDRESSVGMTKFALLGATRRLAISATLILAASGCSSQTNPVDVLGLDLSVNSQALVIRETIDPTIEAFLSSMVEEERFSGVALVKRGDQIIHARAYGRADDLRPNSLDMAFHAGSITKQFTAAAILQLVEREVLSLSTSINKYLPKNYRSEIWESVEVKHLLSHTSGIPDYGLKRDYYAVVDGWPDASTLDGMVREAMETELEFTPGTAFSYANIGYTLLGLIIREVTDQAYEDYVESQILAPMGMVNSKLHRLNHAASPNESQGHRWNETEQRHTKDLEVTLPVTPADGGLITTLSDFHRWIEIYQSTDSHVLSQKSVRLMTQPAIPEGSYDWAEESLRGDATYGFGLTLSGDLIMHEGSIVGYRSKFIYSRNDDLLIVVFTNNTTNSPHRIARGLFELNEENTALQSSTFE